MVSVLRDVAATLSTPVMSAGLCVLRDVIATANSVMSAGHCVLRDVTDRVLRGITALAMRFRH